MKKCCFIFCVAASFLLCSSCATYLSSNKEKVITAYMPSKYLKYYIRPGKMAYEAPMADTYVMIDFSYQMDKRAYVSNAYTNFTLYDRSEAFIDSAYFLFPDGTRAVLSEISTLDRNTTKGYIRISTILEQQNIERVLTALEKSDCILTVILEDGTSKSFVATEDLATRIREAFSK